MSKCCENCLYSKSIRKEDKFGLHNYFTYDFDVQCTNKASDCYKNGYVKTNYICKYYINGLVNIDDDYVNENIIL